MRYFSVSDGCVGPDWLFDPLAAKRVENSSLDWYKIPDFNGNTDIKVIWELSRFHWFLDLALQSKRYFEESRELKIKLARYLVLDWLISNPPFKGPNWKCGQEASLRLINFLMALALEKTIFADAEFVDEFIAVHLKRIILTLNYAKSQRNNHIISEAIALMLGGSRLSESLNPRFARTGNAACNLGSAVLKTSLPKLVSKDGGFSQYSLNYHRLVLDLLTLLFLYSKNTKIVLEPSIMMIHSKLENWLSSLVVSGSRVAPRIGADDGSDMLWFLRQDPSDFLSSVELALYSRLEQSTIESLPLNFDEVIELRQILPKTLQASEFLDRDWGVLCVRDSSFDVYLRGGCESFRIGQDDCGHVDIWYKGVCIIGDQGSFSYAKNGDEEFCQASRHNTVVIEGQSQSLQVGRFLRIDGPRVNVLDSYRDLSGSVGLQILYSDRASNFIDRRIKIAQNKIEIFDRISSESESIELNFWLGDSVLSVDKVSNSSSIISFRSGIRVLCEVQGGTEILRVDLADGIDRYLRKKQVFKICILPSTNEVTTYFNVFDGEMNG